MLHLMLLLSASISIHLGITTLFSSNISFSSLKAHRAHIGSTHAVQRVAIPYKSTNQAAIAINCDGNPIMLKGAPGTICPYSFTTSSGISVPNNSQHSTMRKRVPWRRYTAKLCSPRNSRKRLERNFCAVWEKTIPREMNSSPMPEENRGMSASGGRTTINAL